MARSDDKIMKGKTEYFGIFKGRVESSLDPLNIGRMKVRIPSFHGIIGNEDYIESEDLPWASYCSPTGAGTDHGTFIPAEKGDYVWVVFEDGDPDKPVVLGGSYGIGSSNNKTYGEGEYEFIASSNSNEVPLESQVDNTTSTTKVLYKSLKGMAITIEEKNGGEELSIVDRIGQCILMKCPYGKGTRRRSLRWDKKDGLDPVGEASIEIHDAYGNIVKTSKSGIDLVNSECSCGISIQDGKITILGDLVVEGKISNK